MSKAEDRGPKLKKMTPQIYFFTQFCVYIGVRTEVVRTLYENVISSTRRT